jgi:AcrR family transcriptional regulator
MSRSHPSSEEREARRVELLDAAVAAIRLGGPGVSMEELARSAGVTKPILYRHFGHRDGLVAALATRFADALEETLRAALSAGTAPHDTLVATIDAYLAFVERDPEVYRFLVHRLQSEPPEVEISLGNFLRQVSVQVAVVLGEQLRSVGLDSGGAEPLAYGIVGMVHAAGDWWLERQTMPRARLVEYLAGVLWSGLSGVGLGAPGVVTPPS